MNRSVLAVGALVFLLTGALVGGCGTTGKAPLHAARPGSPAAMARNRALQPGQPERLPVGTMGAYRVAQHEFIFVDRSRPGLGPRTLLTLVRYPVIPATAPASGRLARGLFPLVVFAPGYTQCEDSYAILLDAWASAGYVVAGVDFPRTSCHLGDPDESDLVNQPADIAYVIRRMLAASLQPTGFLAGLIDPGKIAVAGHSDGGDTVAAIAANTCCRDPAVKAAMVLSGAEWPPMPGSYFTRATPPILFVQGDADDINPPADSIMMYQADTTGPRFYLDLLGAGHPQPYEARDPAESVVARVTVDFLDRYLGRLPDAAAAMGRDGQVAGVAALVSGNHLPP